MDLLPYVERLRAALAEAAELGGDDARALAERLATALESALRLALLDALSAAADEITRDLAPGSVELRLRGREPSFVVTAPPVDHLTDGAEPSSGHGTPPVAPEAEEGAMSRISLRLSDHLKGQIEEAASGEGLSVNAWLVRAAAVAVRGQPAARPPERHAPHGGQRYVGWVR